MKRADAYHVRWCGHDVNGSPFATREEAEAVMERLRAGAKYGSYDLVHADEPNTLAGTEAVLRRPATRRGK